MKIDEKLSQLKKELSQGWSISETDKKIIIEYKDEVWVLFENKINAPISRRSKEEEIQRIKEFGKKQKARFVFRKELKWNKEQYKKVEEENQAIRLKAFQELPEKHQIESLYSKALSRKGLDTYVAKTGDDQKRIDAFEKEKEELLKTQKKLPEYESSLYSLFQIEVSGLEDSFQTVYPNVKMVEVLNLIKKILKVEE